MDLSDFKFDWVEYSVVAVMLLLSNLIGVYYTFFEKQETFDDYMLGGKTMGVFPVTMSIIASFVTGITLVGYPTEVYVYGTQYSASNFANCSIMLIAGIFYLPVFFKLQLNSVFEYLELRFNYNVRIIGTMMYSLSLIIYLPVIIYVPALTFNQVTDVPIHVITPVICVSCLFYTAFGGLKAVLWTDTLQNIFTIMALFVVVIIGCDKLGGVEEVMEISEQGRRLELFNMDPDPFARNTFFTVLVGCVFIFLTNIAVNPGSVQRFLSVPSLTKARLVLLFSSIGFYIVVNLSYFMGLVIFARYYKCDPVAAGVIKNHGQMVPLYVMEIGKNYPGLAGLFISGVLSAALSSMSAWLNTVGGTLYKDVMEVFFPTITHSESKQANFIKAIVITLGLLSMALVGVVAKLGTIMQVAVSVQGIAYGSLLALFTLGMFLPRVNAKGAIAGVLASVLVTTWIVVNAQFYIMEGKIKFPGKATSIEECPTSVLQHYNSSTAELFTYTGVGSPVVTDSSVSLIYRLSYNYYIVLGTLTGVLVGMLASLTTDPPDLAAMNPDVFSEYVQGWLPKKKSKPRPKKEEYVLTSQKENLEEVKVNKDGS